jgi:hypothetical protein
VSHLILFEIKMQILRQVFPGQLHFIAKHLFNAVIVADLSDDSALEWTINLAGLSQRGVPLRMGVIVMTPNAAPIEAGADVANQPLGVILAKVWAFLERAHSVHVAGEFITRVHLLLLHTCFTVKSYLSSFVYV